MSSRSLFDLHPDLYPKAILMIKLLGEQGVDYLCYCTFRPDSEQNKLYAQGRTEPGKIVTYARGGQSKHNFTLDGKMASKAFDGAPLVGGKIVWDIKHPHWQKIGEVGHSLNLTWGMDWKKFKEMPHFELKD